VWYNNIKPLKPKSPKYTQSHKYNKRELNTEEKYSLKFSKHKSTTRVRSNRLKWVYMILYQQVSLLPHGRSCSLCSLFCSLFCAFVLIFLKMAEWLSYQNAQASLISQSQKLLPCFNNRMNELQLTTHFVKAF
jgi:hypothetical protein